MRHLLRSRLFIFPVLAFLGIMAGLIALAVAAQGTPAATAFRALPPAHPLSPAVLQEPRHTAVPQAAAVRHVTAVPAPYSVRARDTLSAIAGKLCGTARDWTGIYLASKRIIGSNPDLIFPGQLLTVSCTHPYVALPAVPQPSRISQPQGSSSPVQPHGTPVYRAPAYHAAGIYSYAGLMALWESAGGSAGTAAHAACIAEHESGGNPGAISPTNDWGLWQIHAGGYAMLNPYANAARAVAMSSDGTNWSQWTTAGFC